MSLIRTEILALWLQYRTWVESCMKFCPMSPQTKILATPLATAFLYSLSTVICYSLTYLFTQWWKELFKTTAFLVYFPIPSTTKCSQFSSISAELKYLSCLLQYSISPVIPKHNFILLKWFWCTFVLVNLTLIFNLRGRVASGSSQN